MSLWFRPLRPCADALPIAPAREHARARAQHAAIEAWLAAGARDGRPRASRRWTRAEHLEHALRAEQQMLARVCELAQGRCAAAEARGGPSAAGWIALALGWIPRGRGESPAALQPARAATRAELAALLADSRAAWPRALEACGAPAALRARHFAFGALNARQWLRYARIHTQHHLRIALAED